MEKQKKLTAKEIRIKLHRFENELRKHSGSNKLVDKYLSKITYMQMHFRTIRIDKDTLNGWRMPDYNDINEMRRLGKEKKNNGKNNYT